MLKKVSTPKLKWVHSASVSTFYSRKYTVFGLHTGCGPQCTPSPAPVMGGFFWPYQCASMCFLSCFPIIARSYMRESCCHGALESASLGSVFWNYVSQFGQIKLSFLLPLEPWLLSLLALTHNHHGLCRIEALVFLLLSVCLALAGYSCVWVCMHTHVGEREGQAKALGSVPQVLSNVAVGIASLTGMLLGWLAREPHGALSSLPQNWNCRHFPGLHNPSQEF